VYEQQRKRLLAFRPSQAQSRYQDVYATFEASAEILQLSNTESASDALQLLPVLASFGPGRLPLPLFEAGWKGAQTISPNETGEDNLTRLTPWHVSHLLPLIQAGADRWDSFRLIEALHLLQAFSLLSTDSIEGFLNVSMHPLIHAWARDRLSPKQQHESWVTAGCLVAISCNKTALWQKHSRQLQPHLQTLASWEMSRIFATEPLMMVVRILMNCGWQLHEMRDDAKVFVLMDSLFAYLGLDRLIIDPGWVELYDLTAQNLNNYGKAKEAVSLLEQVVKIDERALAEDHPYRLTSQRNLAKAYQANGQVKKAVSH
jgi:tetratricopeptide (TPR) repeat protein